MKCFLLLWVALQLLQTVRPKIYAHVIVHAHADAGWTRTFENIYTNTGKKILDSVVDALFEEEKYRFNWADLIFLERWWQDIDDVKKKKFKVVLERKQLQIVHPGWVMHDEATVPFYEVMDNFEIGLHFLQDTFNYTPHIAWALDTFGLSGYTPPLLKKYGIDTVYVSRIGNMNRDYIEKLGYINYIWEGHPVNGEPTPIFVCQSQFGTYSPGGLAYDVGKLGYRCKMEDLDRDPPEDCLHALYWEAMNDFVNSKVYSRGGTIDEWHFPILVGDDGAFTNAQYNFEFLDKYFAKFNQYIQPLFDRDVEMIYSTMDEYLAEMKKSNYAYAYHQGDWLPEIEDPGMWGQWKINLEYWDGVYSSYPVYKGLIRKMFKQMRQSQAFFAFVAYQTYISTGDILSEKFVSRNVDAQLTSTINLHHDAVTGTHTVNVNYDYVDKIARANAYSRSLISMLSDQFDSVFSDQSVPVFPEIPLDKLARYNVQEIKVFNPDAKTLKNQPFNVTVHFEKKYFLAVDQELKPVELQSLPIFDFNKKDKLQVLNATHADLSFLVEALGPFQLTHLYLFEFYNHKECLAFFGYYLKREWSLAESSCLPGKPDVYQASKAQPKIQVETEEHFFQLDLDPKTGLISKVTYQDTEVELLQGFHAYEFWDWSDTGFYLFDPNRAPFPIQNLKVAKIYKYSGAIYECLHAIIERNYWLETLHNAYFQNRICVEKKHPERVRQTLSTKSVIGYEILLRSSVVAVDSVQTKGSLEYFTHDSMYGMRRKSYTYEEAVERKIVKTHEQRGQDPNEGTDPHWQANSYPCNTGLFVREKTQKVVLGFTFEHSVMCQLINYQEWQIMVTRATQNPHFQQGIHDQQDDFDYTTFDMNFLMRKISEDAEFDEFISSYYGLDQDQTMGLLVYLKPLEGSPGFKVDPAKASPFMNFFDENPGLQLFKTTWDPHMNRIYFHMANKYSHIVPFHSMKVPEEIEQHRCSVDENFFCGDSRFTSAPVSMAQAEKGQHLVWTEYERYELFEQNQKPFFAFVQDANEHQIPPLSYFSVYLQLPEEPERINHFKWEHRDFYKSERKTKTIIYNPYVLCYKITTLFGLIIAYYFVNVFFFYAIYKGCLNHQDEPPKKKAAGKKT